MKKCFIICKNDKLISDIVLPALKDDDYEFNMFNEDIIDKDMILSIIESDLMIAEIDNTDPIIYYALGLRHKSGKPCINLMEKKDGSNLIFDLNLKVVVYDLENIENSQETFVKMLEETIKYKSPLKGIIKELDDLDIEKDMALYKDKIAEPLIRFINKAAKNLINDPTKLADYDMSMSENKFRPSGGSRDGRSGGGRDFRSRDGGGSRDGRSGGGRDFRSRDGGGSRDGRSGGGRDFRSRDGGGSRDGRSGGGRDFRSRDGGGSRDGRSGGGRDFRSRDGGGSRDGSRDRDNRGRDGGRDDYRRDQSQDRDNGNIE